MLTLLFAVISSFQIEILHLNSQIQILISEAWQKIEKPDFSADPPGGRDCSSSFVVWLL